MALQSEADVAWAVRRRTRPGNPVEAGRGRVQAFRRDSGALFRLRAGALTREERRRVYEIKADVAEGLYPPSSVGLDGELEAPT